MLYKLLFRLSTLTRSAANDDTSLRQEVCPPSLDDSKPSRGTRWLDSLSSWLRGSGSYAPAERAPTDLAQFDRYLESTQLPDADTRLCPRVVEDRGEHGAAFGASRAFKAAQQLVMARRELSEALADIPAHLRHDLQARVRQAQTLRELWYLRPDVYTVISIERDEAEAGRRLAAVNRHFPMRSPRTGALLQPQGPNRPTPSTPAE